MLADIVGQFIFLPKGLRVTWRVEESEEFPAAQREQHLVDCEMLGFHC